MTVAEAIIHKPHPYIFCAIPVKAKRIFSMLDVEYHVCKYYGLEIPKLHLKTNKRDIVKPRQICWYMIKEFVYDTGVSEIGRYFKKDHTTVLHGLTTVKNLIATDDEYNKEITEIHRIIKHLCI